MISLRMLAIAGTLLLLAPLGAWADSVATGADAPPASAKAPAAREQVVEGHTAFVTLDVGPPPP